MPMYVIEYFNGMGLCYFSRFNSWGMEEYVGKRYPDRMMKFETKKEAAAWAKQMLRGKHSIVKLKEEE